MTASAPYPSGTFTAGAAGAYKWVASYSGDALHAASTTACNDPAGAFAVVAPPTVSAAFGAQEIGVGESTALTFTITNPPANTVALTGVALENTLPAGLVVASPNGSSGSCGAGTITAGPGSQSVTLAGGTIPVGSTCSFSVQVTGSAPGSVTNTTGAVQSANGGAGQLRDGVPHGARGAGHAAGHHAAASRRLRRSLPRCHADSPRRSWRRPARPRTSYCSP